MCNAKAKRVFLSFLLLAAVTQPVAVVPLPLVQDSSTGGGWVPCRACGIGVSTRRNQCASNDACLRDTLYRSCFITECPANTSSFRDRQCAAFNTIGPSQTLYTWAPVPSTSCQLVCVQTAGSGMLNVLAADGTDCLTTSGDRGICAGGNCMSTGCDGILGSGKVLDECNRCLAPNVGDGRCVRFLGSIGGTQIATRKQDGNNTDCLIPVGASSINVTHMKKPHEKGLMLTSKQEGRYVISDYAPGDIQLFGVIFHYELRQELTFDVQTLLVQGPLPTDISVQVLPNSTSSSGVLQYYQLTAQLDTTDSTVDSQEIPGLGWTYSAFSTCSVSCGLGVEISTAKCADLEYPDRNIPDDLCGFLADSRPQPLVRWCSMGPCPPKWKALTWGMCSASCGGGVQTRPLQCLQLQVDGMEVVVNSSSCPASGMPPQKQVCNSRPCQPHWQAGAWGPCSTTCGSGIQTRSVVCADINGQIVNKVHCEDDETPPPPSTTLCSNNQACCSWATQDWGPCAGVCGSMYKYRPVLCLCEGSGGLYQGSGCSNSSRPENKQRCLQTSCPTWQTGAWGPCSATCGPGISYRAVYCTNGNQTATGCDITTQPSNVVVCQANRPCCTPCVSGCANIQGIDCNYVKRTGQCNGYYQQACCQTCSDCCNT
ncbi:hypothetical protein EMCRGX_G021239 [Ephydatia muelleri]|eukprot:Em0016g1107a